MSLASSSKNEIQLLGTSAAFAMSLGAKELFHTNFLAFLLESDDSTLAPMQLAIRDALGFLPSPGAVPKCVVWREKNNLDLIIVELQPPAFDSTSGSTSAGQGVPTADENDTVEHTGEENDTWDWNPVDGWKQSKSTGTNVATSSTAASASCYRPTGRVLIVEVKLKSIPNLDQLIEYDDQLASPGIELKYPEDAAVPEWNLRIGGKGTASIERRLLSVTGISMTTPATAKRPAGDWAGVKWKDLHCEMHKALGALAGSSLHQTVTDYTDALGALVTLIDRVHQMSNDAHVIPPPCPTYGAVRRQALAPQFKSLRISDLLGKTLFDHWLNTYVLKKAMPVSIPAGWTLNSYVHYSRGVPGLGVELINDKFPIPSSANTTELHIGIQIQDGEFRLFISTPQAWNGLESWIATHPSLLSGWFSTPVFDDTPVGYRGQPVTQLSSPGRKTNLKVFDVNRFLYSKYDIDNQSVVDVELKLASIVALAARLAPSL